MWVFPALAITFPFFRYKYLSSTDIGMESSKNKKIIATNENNKDIESLIAEVKKDDSLLQTEDGSGVIHYYIKKDKSGDHYNYYLAENIWIGGKRTNRHLESFGREVPVFYKPTLLKGYCEDYLSINSKAILHGKYSKGMDQCPKHRLQGAVEPRTSVLRVKVW